jgi:hypothetical protein
MVDQARAERLAEHRKAFGQDRAVDAILQVGVIVADVELAKAVLHHAGQLQHDLAELLVVATRQSLDLRIGHAIGIGTQAFLDAARAWWRRWAVTTMPCDTPFWAPPPCCASEASADRQKRAQQRQARP